MEITQNILIYIFYCIEIFILSYAMYYVITGIFAFFKRKTIPKCIAKNRFAIIIPARNEEKVIGALIKSLKKMNYPRMLYDIIVIPNGCNDNTEKIAKHCGANILSSSANFNSKGEVLKFAFNNLINSNYDAFCIFDADNIVDKKFLSRMNDAIENGVEVAQGFRESKNPNDSWIASCYSLFYLIQNLFFNLARSNMNLSASINGTGFMIKKDVIKRIGFDTKTVTEDIEFAGICALNNIKIEFIKDAITYDEQPIDFKSSWKQRKRWSFGTLQCLENYFFKLLKKGVADNIPQCIDMALFYIAPIFQVLSFVSIILLGICTKISNIALLNFMFDNQFISLILGYLASILISLIVIIKLKKQVKKYFNGVLTLSIFMLTWIPINIICLMKKDFKWEKIEHTRNIDINSLV